MINLLFFSLLLPFQDAREVIYLREHVEIELVGGIIDAYDRDIYFDKKSLRIDESASKRSYLFRTRTDPPMIIVLHHDEQSFSYGLVKHDRNLIRTMLKGLGYYVDGQLQQRAGNLKPTGLKRKISNWQCQEYALDYPSLFGVSTKIWCTNEKTMMTKTNMKALWYAIIGGTPSQDVNKVITQFFRDIPGIPIQFVTKIEQQNTTITITSHISTMGWRQITDSNFFEIPKNYRVIMRSKADQ